MSISTFIVENTYTDVKTHQSVYSDGTNIWTTNAGNTSQESGVYRYDMTPTLLTSHANATNDITGAESDVVQMNGMHLKDGKLYISAMNYPNGSDDPLHGSLGGLYQHSYITRWDATTLAYEAKWAVGDSTVTGATSAAKWSEGITWHAGSSRWFVCFHGSPVLEEYSQDGSGDLVYVARHTLPSVDNTAQTYNALGFEDVTCAGDYFYLNRHVATFDLYLYIFKWTGSGFTFVKKELSSQIGASGYNQGVNIQPGTNIMWWTRRTAASLYGDLGDISKVRVVGFDLNDFNNGVHTSTTNAVRYGNSNGIIIGK